MAKKTALELKREGLRKFRLEQSAALNAYCKEHKICVRCRNPEKKLITETLCDACSAYYKDYAVRKRQEKAKKLPVKKVVKSVKSSAKPVGKKPAKKGK